MLLVPYTKKGCHHLFSKKFSLATFLQVAQYKHLCFNLTSVFTTLWLMFHSSYVKCFYCKYIYSASGSTWPGFFQDQQLLTGRSTFGRNFEFKLYRFGFCWISCAVIRNAIFSVLIYVFPTGNFKSTWTTAPIPLSRKKVTLNYP